MIKVDNAIIMAAGISGRFAPISYEKPKGMIAVKGEILIERQIRQLQEAGIREIIVVVGYKKEWFYHLAAKYGVKIVENKEYDTRNNHSSIYAARDFLGNSYICSSDNYFCRNPFETCVAEPYYAAVFAEGETGEWCLDYDSEGWITDVVIGGCSKWYMLGHTFWDEKFSRSFLRILESGYRDPSIREKLWEGIYIEHLEELKLKIRKYPANYIFEFDSLDELRAFDQSYVEDTRSDIIKRCAEKLNCRESDLMDFKPLPEADGSVWGCVFRKEEYLYNYSYASDVLREKFTSM